MKNILECSLPPGGILEDFFLKRVLKTNKILAEFEFRTKNFIQNQKEALDQIIERNEGTRWGRDHKFSRLNHKNWNSMPVITYEQVEPYMNRLRNGDVYALTNEVPEALALTSGTSSTPKFIPLTESSISNQKKGADVWNLSLRERCSKQVNKILILSGGSRKKKLEILPVKSYTDIVKAKQPGYVQKRMIFSKEVESVSDLEHRLLIAAQQAFIRQPTLLISVNPITILKLLELTDENRAEIGRATVKGKYIGTDINTGEIKNKNTILGNIFSKNPLDSLKFIGTWLGGTQHLFIDELKNKGFNIPMRDLGYMATEGRFSIPIEDNTPRGILNPFGHYYEFAELNSRNLLPIQELEQGKEYNIIVTGENGLYRYDIQDIIRMEGRYNEAPIISFMRKDECFSSLMGEKIHENHVVELLKQLKTERGFLIARTDPPHYELTLNGGGIEKIKPELADNLLQKINPEYAQKRENNRLQSLELNYLEKPTFDNLDKRINPNQEHDRYKKKYLVPYGKLEEK